MLLHPDTLEPLDTQDVELGQRVVIEAPSLDGHGTTFTEGTVTEVVGEHVTITALVYPLNDDVLAYCYTPGPHDQH